MANVRFLAQDSVGETWIVALGLFIKDEPAQCRLLYAVCECLSAIGMTFTLSDFVLSHTIAFSFIKLHIQSTTKHRF
jgi:hypothetical protein